MEIYFFGAAVALLIGFFKIAVGIFEQDSIRARNMEKIGCYYRAMKGTYIGQSPGGNSFAYFYVLFIAPLGSWLSVISAALTYFTGLSNGGALPDKIKELQFRIKTAEYSVEEMKKIEDEILSVLGKPKTPGEPIMLPTPTFMETNFERRDTLEFKSGDFDVAFKINVPSQKVSIFGTRADKAAHFSEVEYKINKGEVLIRYVSYDYDIKDNVVLESTLRTKFKGEILDEEIVKLKELVVWHKPIDYKLRFFIISHHPEQLTHLEARKIARQEIERISLAKEKYDEAMSESGLVVNYNKYTGRTEYKSGNLSASEREKLFKYADDYVEIHSINEKEIHSAEKIIGHLLEFLGEKKVN